MPMDNLVFFMLIFIILFLVAALVLVASWAIYNRQRGNSHRQPQQRMSKSPQSTTQLAQPERAAAPIYPSDVDTKPTKLILGSTDNPLGEIARYQKEKSDRLEEIQDKRALLGISSWFQQAPNLALSGAQIMQNSYVLTFKPEIAKGIADGSLKIMESANGGIRAIAVDGKNVIQGAGSLHLATGLKAAASVAAIWQVLATITAQKFLVNINRQLEKIDKKLEAIKKFLEYERYGKMIGSLNYIRGVQEALNSQRFESLELGVFLNKLEDIVQECTQIMAALELQRKDVYDASIEQSLEAPFKLKDKFKNFQKLIADYEGLARSYLIAIAVTVLAYQTRFALPANHNLTVERLSNLHTKLTAWDEHQQEFYGLVRERIPEIISPLNPFDDEEGMQSQLRQQADESQGELTQSKREVQRYISDTENKVRRHLEEISQPLSLVVQLDEKGQITKTWKLHR